MCLVGIWVLVPSETVPVGNTPPEHPSSDLPLPLPRRCQPAALPPPREKSTRVKKVPERYTDSNVYGEKHPVQVEKDIKRQRDWRKVVGEESSHPRRQAIPGGVPVPDSVPYYSSGEEDLGSSSEEEVDDTLGSPSSSGDEKVARLSREGGVAFFNFLISKAIVTPKEKGPKEWTYRDVMGLPAGQLEEWRAACQHEIETLLKRNVFDIVERPSGCRVSKNCWVFDVKPNGRKRARLVAKGFSQVEGMDFDQIFSPVVRFETVRLILTLAALEGWYTFMVNWMRRFTWNNQKGSTQRAWKEISMFYDFVVPFTVLNRPGLPGGDVPCGFCARPDRPDIAYANHPANPAESPSDPRSANEEPSRNTSRRPPSRRAHDHRSAHDFDATGAFEAPKGLATIATPVWV